MSAASRTLMIIGSLSLLAAVQLSALGAHALDARLSPRQLDAWAWATQLQAWHSIGLLLIGMLLMQLRTSALLVWAGGIMTLGLLLFSGCIYVSTLGGPAIFASIPPFGGSSFMIAWLLVAIAIFRHRPPAA